MAGTLPSRARAEPGPAILPPIDERNGWRRLAPGARVLCFRGYVAGRSPEALAAEAARLTASGAAAWLDGLDGHFSLVLLGPAWSLATADAVRRSPLVRVADGGRVLVAHDGPALVARLGLGPEDVDGAQAAAFALPDYWMAPLCSCAPWPGWRRTGEAFTMPPDSISPTMLKTMALMSVMSRPRQMHPSCFCR